MQIYRTKVLELNTAYKTLRCRNGGEEFFVYHKKQKWLIQVELQISHLHISLCGFWEAVYLLDLKSIPAFLA